MQKTKEDVSEGLKEIPDMTIAEMRAACKQDLRLVFTFVQLILSDENTMNSLADFMHGRLQNARNAQALKRQQELDLKSN